MAGESVTGMAPAVEWEDEQLRVNGWRLGQLLEAGYGVVDANLLASRLDIDLHAAVELVARGCPPETATKILL